MGHMLEFVLEFELEFELEFVLKLDEVMFLLGQKYNLYSKKNFVLPSCFSFLL